MFSQVQHCTEDFVGQILIQIMLTSRKYYIKNLFT